jgi:hypothetical protein
LAAIGDAIDLFDGCRRTVTTTPSTPSTSPSAATRPTALSWEACVVVGSAAGNTSVRTNRWASVTFAASCRFFSSSIARCRTN